jgi:hypothetical protein
VRIFAHPRVVADLRLLENLPQLLDEAIGKTEGGKTEGGRGKAEGGK